MKNRLIAALSVLIFFATACVKEEAFTGMPVTCTHIVYYSYLACPDPLDPLKWEYTNVQSFTETVEMADSDTMAWLAATRLYDEQWKVNPAVPTWAEFAHLFSNECGCE